MRSNAGTTLPETLIVIGIVLALLFGVTQLTLLGYNQSAAVGAAFVGAHAAGINSSGSAATDQTYAQGIIAPPFPNVAKANTVLTYPAGSNTLQVVVTQQGQGLTLSPNGIALQNLAAPPTPSLEGVDIEPVVTAGSINNTTSSLFGVQALLANYCTAAKVCTATHPLYIGQYDVPSASCNGNCGGQFAEWACRQGLFPGGSSNSINVSSPPAWPSTRPAPSSIYDPANASFELANLYAFDTQTSSWNTQSSMSGFAGKKGACG